jgi:hypothetical protein
MAAICYHSLSLAFNCSSQSQSYITTDGQSASLSWSQALISDPWPMFLLLSLIIVRQLRICWCGAPSLTGSRVCSFQFLRGVMSIFYCLYFWDTANVDGQAPVFISPRNRVAQLYHWAQGSSIILNTVFAKYLWHRSERKKLLQTVIILS